MTPCPKHRGAQTAICLEPFFTRQTAEPVSFRLERLHLNRCLKVEGKHLNVVFENVTGILFNDTLHPRFLTFRGPRRIETDN